MKKIKKTLMAVAGIASIMAPLSLGAIAHAQEVNPNPVQLNCTHDSDAHGSCDLAVDKQVSVNDGPFVEADTSADAAQAHVGDTITWKITLSNTSSATFIPTGIAYVNDVLPSSGVTYGSYSATVGTYSTSGFFANDWIVPLVNSDNGSNLPATLTLTSVSNATGLFKNTAALVKYDNLHCDGGCVYSDANPANDSNDAWIDPSTPPVVLGDTTTLVNTGSGTIESAVAAVLILATAGTVLLARPARSNKN